MENLSDGLEHEPDLSLAESALRSFEEKFFKGVAPVNGVEIVDDPTFCARYLPELKIIQLNAAVARFPNLRKFLILHELIHHKLVLTVPGYSEKPYGEPFDREAKEMVRRGAYDGLL
jgi:hypothetical protein